MLTFRSLDELHSWFDDPHLLPLLHFFVMTELALTDCEENVLDALRLLDEVKWTGELTDGPVVWGIVLFAVSETKALVADMYEDVVLPVVVIVLEDSRAEVQGAVGVVTRVGEPLQNIVKVDWCPLLTEVLLMK